VIFYVPQEYLFSLVLSYRKNLSKNLSVYSFSQNYPGQLHMENSAKIFLEAATWVRANLIFLETMPLAISRTVLLKISSSVTDEDCRDPPEEKEVVESNETFFLEIKTLSVFGFSLLKRN